MESLNKIEKVILIKKYHRGLLFCLLKYAIQLKAIRELR